MSQELLQAALRYAARDQPVFPLRQNSKEPRAGIGAYHGTTDPTQITDWWTKWPEANIGIQLGVAGNAIDIESVHIPAFKSLCSELGVDLSQVTSVSTPNGGLHLHVGLTGHRNFPHRFGEFRSTGWYVVLPPSKTKSGQYFWILEGLPTPGLESLVEALKPERPETCCPHSSLPEYQYFDSIYQNLASETWPGRHHALFGAAFTVGGWIEQCQLDREEVETSLYSACEANGMVSQGRSREVTRTIKDGLDLGESLPHVYRPIVLSINGQIFSQTGPEPVTPQTAQPVNSHSNGHVQLLTADRLQIEAVEWWWRNHIPLGRLGLLGGDPGLGKSVILCDFAAAATTGRTLPDGSKPLKVGGAVIYSAEDGLQDTILPRLKVAGADLSKVLVAHSTDSGHALQLPRDLKQLEDTLVQMEAVMVCFDPWEFYLKADIIKGREQREALEPVLRLFAKLGVVALGNGHLNQQPGQQALYRIRGDITGIAVTRWGFLVGRDPTSEDRMDRVMTPLKYNLAPEDRLRGASFAIESVPLGVFDSQGIEATAPRIQWKSSTTLTSDQVVKSFGSEGLTARQVMETVVLPVIREKGPIQSSEGYQILLDHGVSSSSSVQSARKKLGIETVKLQDKWWWYAEGQESLLPLPEIDVKFKSSGQDSPGRSQREAEN